MVLVRSFEESGRKPTLGTLRATILKASSWILVGHFLSLGIRLFGTLILTRIFAPEIFGILAIVTVVQIVTHLFTDIGISQSVIQSPRGQDHVFLNTAWTVQILRGVIIWILGLLTAAALEVASRLGWLAPESVYAYPGLPLILAVACFSAVIMGFQSTKVILASRNLDMRRVTIIELVSQLVTLAFTVVVGYATRSIWSYVASGLLYSAVCVGLGKAFLKGVNNRFAWDQSALLELSNFGRWIFISSGLGGIATNSDRMILGGIVTAPVLGFYSIASNLVGMVDIVAGRIFGMVALPALSSVARTEPDRLPWLFHRTRLAVDPCIIALAGFLFASADLIISILYDARYVEAGSMLRILSVSLLLTRYNLAQSVYIALGLPSYLTWINIVKLASMASMIPTMFYFDGERGAVLAIALHMAPVVLLTFYLNSLHKLNSLKLEFLVLCFWPAGWLLGSAVAKVFPLLKIVLHQL